jgi:DNA-binding NtrC family response regulator
VRELENTMHRAVLLARGDGSARRHPAMPDGTPRARRAMTPERRKAAETAEAIKRALVGRTVADVERDLILDTLDHVPRQPHPCRQHPRHLDPHAAQQAQPVPTRASVPAPEPAKSAQ